MDRNTRRVHAQPLTHSPRPALRQSAACAGPTILPPAPLLFALLPALLFVWLGTAVLSASPAQAAKLSQHAQRMLYNVNQLMEKKEFAKATQSLQKYIDDNDGDVPPQAYTMLGNCLLEKDKISRAYKTFRQGIQHHPDAYNLQYNLGVAAYSLEKFKPAAQAFEKAYAIQQTDTEKYGDMPELLYQAAACHYMIKDHAKALQRLDQLLARPDIRQKGPKPNWVKLKVHLLCQLKRWKQAENELTKLLHTYPTLNDYWELLAQVYLNRDKHALAASALETAYALKPPKASRWRSLADIYMYLNAPLQAARCLHKAAPKDMDERLSDIYTRTNRYGQAIAACDKLIASTPCAAHYLLKARLLLNADKPKQSMETYLEAAQAKACRKGKKTRRKKSIRGEAYTMAALVAWDLKDWDKVLEYFGKAEQTTKPYSQQAKYGKELAKDILHARVVDPDRVPTIK